MKTGDTIKDTRDGEENIGTGVLTYVMDEGACVKVGDVEHWMQRAELDSFEVVESASVPDPEPAESESLAEIADDEPERAPGETLGDPEE